VAPQPVRILLVSGSLEADSTNTALLTTAQSMIPEGVLTMLYDGLGDLPEFEPADADAALPPAPAQLHALLADCDAVLFSTPEDDGALPGALKNLFDWTAGGATAAMAVAWVDASATAAGAAGAHAALRDALTAADAEIVEGACTRLPVTSSGIGKDGLIADARLRSGVGWVLKTLADHVRARRASTAIPGAGEGEVF
jgi:NAD(P)H-dependent FMN reductase